MRTYFILGDSRSGTSLVGRILHTNGIEMGKTFKKPTSNNPHGYFEDLKLREMNALAGGYEEFAKEYVQYRKTDKWGMKNPPLLPFHVEYFLPYLDEVRFIVTKRDRESQKRSIYNAINKLDEEKMQKRLDATYTKIEEVIKDHESIEIQFEDWFNDKAEAQMEKLYNFIEAPYERGAVQKYIEPRLHRYKPNPVANS